MPATAGSHSTPQFQPDEVFISKSLLASLDAQADAEPISNPDDSEHTFQPLFSAASNSASESPSVNYPMAHHPHLSRPESPGDAHKHLHNIRSQEPFYSHSGMYATEAYHRHLDFTEDFDAFAPNNTYRTFTAYPNTTRSRQQTNANSSYRDQAPLYPSSGLDMFTTHVTSPPQSHLPAYDARNPYDFTNGHAGGAHKSYHVDQFNTTPSLLHNPGKQVYQSSYPASVPPTNGVQLSSQTPYGPHLPANVPIGNNAPNNNNAGPPSLPTSGSVATNAVGGEEISTIFVVGFPEDMQEREFQNMFTFSRGFEAATLKIPNKEYTAYGGLVGTVPGPALASGLRGTSFGYNAQNDPYNLNVDGAREGSVWPGSDDLVSNPQHFMAAGGLGGINGIVAPNASAGPASSVPPRKQIIGFAKFRSREEALMARDVLQGKRVDIEKGAVLKAEMAKKNLHTKRGVGPVPGVNLGVTLNPTVAPAGVVVMSQNPCHVQLQQQPAQLTHLNALDTFAEFKARDPTGLSRLGAWRESLALQSASQQQQSVDISTTPLSTGTSRVEERESMASTLSSLSLGSSITASTPTLRGPRERGEEERKKDKERDKELNLMRLRASNSVAFDAFHSVGVNANSYLSASMSGVATPPSGLAGPGPLSMSRQNSTVTSQGTTSGTNSGLLTPSSCTTPTSIPTESDLSPMITGAEAQQKRQDEIVGPWDKMNSVISFIAQGNSRPRSETQGSNSPMPSTQPGDLGAVSALNGLSALGHIGAVLSNVNGTSERENQLLHRQALVTQMVNGASFGIVDSISTSSSASNASTGTTSPTLPSPASGASNGSGSSNGGSVSTTGATGIRGSVDQNPPINTLYVGNLPTSPPPMGYPSDYLEETLREMFSQRPGYRQLSFRQKPAGPMCFVEFEDVTYAAKAKAEMSGNTLRGLVKNGIRLSYSKNPLGVRTSSAGNAPCTLQQHQSHPLVNHSGDGFQVRLQDDTVTGTQHQHRGGVPPPPIPRRVDSFGMSGAGNGNPNTFLSSPPPRFYSSSPGGVAFSSALTGASSAFVPRSMAATASVSSNNASSGNGVINCGMLGGGGHHSPSYSPFGGYATGEGSLHHMVPTQPTSLPSSSEQQTRTED